VAFWSSPHLLRGGGHSLQVRGERIALRSLSCGPPHFHHRRQHGLRHTPKLRGLLSRPRGSGLEPRLLRSGLSLERLSETVQLGLGRRSWCCQSPKPLTRSLAPSELLTLLSASGISALFVWIRHSCFCISTRRARPYCHRIKPQPRRANCCAQLK